MFLSHDIHTQTNKLPVDRFYPQVDTYAQFWFKGHMSSLITLACFIFELLCSDTDRHTQISLCIFLTYLSLKHENSPKIIVHIFWQPQYLVCLQESKKEMC